jgi:hypothetical protein
MTKFVASDLTVDNRTGDLVEGLKAARAREQAAIRQANLRARRAAEGKQSVTVVLPADVVEFLNKFVQFKDISKDHVIEKAIRNALMRKRSGKVKAHE